MSMGIPYDSDQGRDFAGAITAVMCGQAYLTSARIAASIGPFPGYAANEQPFLEVIRMHRDAVEPHQPRATFRRRCTRARSSAGTTPTNRDAATATATRR